MPDENSVQAMVASIFNLSAHNRLNIALNRLNIPLTKTASKLKAGKSWQSQNNQLSGNLESLFFVWNLNYTSLKG